MVLGMTRRQFPVQNLLINNCLVPFVCNNISSFLNLAHHYLSSYDELFHLTSTPAIAYLRGSYSPGIHPHSSSCWHRQFGCLEIFKESDIEPNPIPSLYFWTRPLNSRAEYFVAERILRG